MNWNNVKNSDCVLALRSLITAFRKLQDLMTDSSEKKKVFISYAREDIETAGKLYYDLRKAGLEPWMDKIDLLPGQIWKTEVEKAILLCHPDL